MLGANLLFSTWRLSASGTTSMNAVRELVTSTSYGLSHSGRPDAVKMSWNLRMSCTARSSWRQSSPLLTMTWRTVHPGLQLWGLSWAILSCFSDHRSPNTAWAASCVRSTNRLFCCLERCAMSWCSLEPPRQAVRGLGQATSMRDSASLLGTRLPLRRDVVTCRSTPPNTSSLTLTYGSCDGDSTATALEPASSSPLPQSHPRSPPRATPGSEPPPCTPAPPAVAWALRPESPGRAMGFLAWSPMTTKETFTTGVSPLSPAIATSIGFEKDGLASRSEQRRSLGPGAA
mmetsp:Transcript_3042/g.7129  ORF Transcript_3042/g.7129 Transcript_3042/m.7129 type:complete len:288 (-) Transcript_3042:1302-2165(-)